MLSSTNVSRPGGMVFFVADSSAKHAVDKYIQELGVPGPFVLTGTFYDNLIFRGHIHYQEDTDSIEFRHPVIKGDVNCK